MNSTHRFSVAPMIDWTDRHCRYFHRLLTKHTRLYTEMIVADAILHGDRRYLLGFDRTEHPLALQLGGSDPKKLAEAARIGEDFGYDEINLNVGCPSDRVQSGTFGACLMRTPEQVADCLAAMLGAVSIPVTVKCRLGVDDQKPEETLPAFIEQVSQAGISVIIIHARKAWLEGLSPKENRTIPPLDYALVHQIKQAYPALAIILNGGITSLESTKEHLEHLDGVMMGRAAYETPWILSDADREIFNKAGNTTLARAQIVEQMFPYIDNFLAQGGRLHSITRHMLGLFHGQKGARKWRQILTMEAAKPGATTDVLKAALLHCEQTTDELSVS